MLLSKFLGRIPIIGLLLERTIVGILNIITRNWIFFTFIFIIGFNFWSWVGGSIAATHAINNICPEDEE
jgi:hypothetical protein